MDNFVEYIINNEGKIEETKFKTVYEDTESYGEVLSKPQEISDIVNRQAALEALREIITVNKNQILDSKKWSKIVAAVLALGIVGGGLTLASIKDEKEEPKRFETVYVGDEQVDKALIESIAAKHGVSAQDIIDNSNITGDLETGKLNVNGDILNVPVKEPGKRIYGQINHK